MAKIQVFLLVVIFAVACEACYSDDDCLIGQCCGDTCYSSQQTCPIAGGVMVAIILVVVVVVGIVAAIVSCCCCACCPYYRGSPGHVIVTQPPYQQFGTNVVVASSTHTVAAPQPQYQPQGPPAFPRQGYPQQGYPQQGYPQQGFPQQGYPPAYSQQQPTK